VKKEKCLTSKLTRNGGLTVLEERSISAQIMQFRDEFWRYIDQSNNNNGVDIIISPVCCYPTLPLGFSKNLSLSLTSTMLQNLLDCPAGSIGPICYVQKDECFYQPNSNEFLYFYNQNDSLTKEIDSYMEEAQGLPCNVQVYAKPYQDELVLRVMKELESCMKQV